MADKKTKTEQEKKNGITAIRLKDGTFRFSGRAYAITEAKNKALEPYHCVVHDYGVVLELILSDEQKLAINQQIGNARFIRNRYLSDRIQYYADTKKTLSVTAYKKEYLPKLKKEFPFLACSDKFALESALEHVDQAYQNFFQQQCGFPKFVSKWKPAGNAYTTKFTNHNIEILLGEDGLPYVKLPKIGRVRFVMPKKKTIQDIVPYGTHILSAAIKRSTKTYTVSLQLETVIDKPVFPERIDARRVMSVDLGIKSFAVLCCNDTVEAIKNPRHILIHARRLRRLQKSLSRKQYDVKTHTGSKNWEKAKRKVFSEMRKCANQRKDFHHKLSRRIVNFCDVFVCEDLNVAGMIKNRRLSKEIASVGWSSFLSIVKYKMERAGKYFVKVGRFYASSQTCSHCGYKNAEVKDLHVREWTCPSCGKVQDRDANAAKNIGMEGIRLLQEQGIRFAA